MLGLILEQPGLPSPARRQLQQPDADLVVAEPWPVYGPDQANRYGDQVEHVAATRVGYELYVPLTCSPGHVRTTRGID
jgi:hypothetical protein